MSLLILFTSTFTMKFLLIFLASLHQSFSLRWDGNILYDLEANTIAALTAEATSWTLSSYVTPSVKVYQCGSYVLLGGYNILGGSGSSYSGQYFARTYDSVPIHNQIYIQILFYAIDSWDGGADHFKIGIDGATIFGWTLSKQPAYSSQVCGKSGDAEIPPFTAFVSYAHSATSLTLKIINYANEASDNESLGFRDIKIEFLTSSSPYSSLCSASTAPLTTSTYCQTSCSVSGLSINPSGSGVCSPTSCLSSCNTCAGSPTTCATCKAGEYMVGNSCYPSCDTLSFQQVVLGGITYCKTPCPGQYSLWDKSCSSECSYSTSYASYPIQGIANSTFLQCKYPCNATQYLYWNASCLDSCPSPLTTTTYKGRNFCEFTCAETQYLYWNGTCSGKCEEPLISETQNGRKFCRYKCSEAQFLYWNGSCHDKCDLPLILEVQGTSKYRNFCWYGCSETKYLYWNGSCMDTCPSPLTPETQQGTSSSRKFCWYGCSETKYLSWNGSCLDKCDYPLISEIQGTGKYKNFCWFPCLETQYLYWNGTCLDTCPSPLTPETQQGTSSSRKFCWYGCSDTQYLYWNGSCLGKCDYPLISEVQGIDKYQNFCWYPCPETEYLYWNGSCLDTCPSPLTPEIQQGTSSSRKFCWYGCSAAQHLYWNGSCIDTCPSPLISEVQGVNEPQNFCWSPCQTGQYICGDGSCTSECPLPLIKIFDPQIQYCGNPCENPTHYLYSNDSCLPTCPSLLNSAKNFGVQFCVNPCGTSGKFYLYENKTCLSTCSSPYLKRTEPGVQYCDRPCSEPNIYWYQNASCLGECKFPYVKFNYSGVIQCLSPCKKGAEYFNDYDKKCYSTCESPYKIELIDKIKLCRTEVSISHDEVQKIKETAASIDAQVEIVSVSMKAAALIDSSNPTSALLAALSSMMQYIRYMKINFPPKVQMLFMVAARNPFTLNYGVNVPSFVERHLEDDPLPYTFDRYDISSNFVSNLWDFMMSFSLHLLGVLAVIILKKMTVGYPRINILLGKILQALKWNFLIMMVCGSSGEIVFFASLQLRSSPFKGLSSTICCILSILMMILVVLLLGIAFKIAYVMHRRRRQNLAHEAKADKWKGFEVLYVEYEEKSFFSLAYMFLFLSRSIIFNLTLATLFEYPLVECCIINGCNFLMVCYLIYLRPLKDLLALVQLWINEGLLNILSICVLILGILDYLEVEQETARNRMEDVMLIVIQTFNFVALAFMAISGLIFMRAIYRVWKTGRAKGMRSPLQMFNFLFFGNDDEEVVVDKENEFAKKNFQIEKDFRENNMSTIELKGDSSIGNLICDTSIIQDQSTKILQSGEQATDFEMSPQLFFNRVENDKNLAEARRRRFKVKRRSNILAKDTGEINDSDLKNNDGKNDAENELWFLKFRKLKSRLNWNAQKTDLTIETKIGNL